MFWYTPRASSSKPAKISIVLYFLTIEAQAVFVNVWEHAETQVSRTNAVYGPKIQVATFITMKCDVEYVWIDFVWE